MNKIERFLVYGLLILSFFVIYYGKIFPFLTGPHQPQHVVPQPPSAPLEPRSTAPKQPVRASIPATKPAKELNQVKTFGVLLSQVSIEDLIKSKYDLVIINIADRNSKLFSRTEIDLIKKSNKIVLADVSFGYAEKNRWYWKPEWNSSNPYWIGEEHRDKKNKFLIRDLTHKEWIATAYEIIDRLIATGYDGVVLDGIDSYLEMGAAKALRDKAIEFTRIISEYALSKNKNFKIFASNAELLGRSQPFLQAIDGIVKENVYMSLIPNVKRSDPEVSKILSDLKVFKDANKKVLVVESMPEKLWNSWEPRIKNNGFIGYNAPNNLFNRLRD